MTLLQEDFQDKLETREEYWTQCLLRMANTFYIYFKIHVFTLFLLCTAVPSLIAEYLHSRPAIACALSPPCLLQLKSHMHAFGTIAFTVACQHVYRNMELSTQHATGGGLQARPVPLSRRNLM